MVNENNYYGQGKELEKIEKVGNIKKVYIEKNHKKEFTPTSMPSEEKVIDSMDFKLKFDNVKDRVKSIIKGDKYSRENYLWLDILYYSKMGMLKMLVPLEDFQKANSPETINRAFRKIIEETKQGQHQDLRFLLNNPINEIRKEREIDMENMFIQDKNVETARIVK
ncbi:MAG: hypothetical protein AABW67_04250 [Nanoarchaeota archaeon]